MEYSLTGGEAWNKLDLPLVLDSKTREHFPFQAQKKLSELRGVLREAWETLTSIECLHVEAALLSRILYRNYRHLRRDKGFQFLKMIMGSLNKYLKLHLIEGVQAVFHSIPSRFTAIYNSLPARSVITWLLARIQGFSCLFLRIFNLCKEAGRSIFQRLRLGWGHNLLTFALCIVARIHVIARFLVLKAVDWHSKIAAHIKLFAKSPGDPHRNFPEDLKEWLGGLENMLVTRSQRPKTRIDMVLDLIDLTADDDEGKNIRDFGGSGDEETEIMRLYEMVTLDTTKRSASVEILEDTGEVVVTDDQDIEEIEADEDGGERASVFEEDVGVSAPGGRIIPLDSDLLKTKRMQKKAQKKIRKLDRKHGKQSGLL